VVTAHFPTLRPHTSHMSRWRNHPVAEVIALIFWALGTVAIAILVNGTIAFYAFFGTCLVLATLYLAARRRWWTMSRFLVIGTAGLVNVATVGTHSQAERNLVLAVWLAAIAFNVIATAIQRPRSKAVNRSWS
jgi:hypothetical protein